MKNLIIVTPTWNRAERMAYMRRFSSILRTLESVEWLVVEDEDLCDPELAEWLDHSGISHRYWAVGPSRDKGNLQRNSALGYIVESGLEGIVYNGDDDNFYLPRLFEELRLVRGVALLPVGNLGPSNIERPIVKDGRIQAWDANWTERMYPVDMAGFAFHSSLLAGLCEPLWDHRGLGGESEFLEKIVADPHQIEFLCDGCTTCLVWHNHGLEEDASVHQA